MGTGRRGQRTAQRSGKPRGLGAARRAGRSRSFRRLRGRALGRLGELTGQATTGQTRVRQSGVRQTRARQTGVRHTGTAARPEARTRAAELGAFVAGGTPAGTRLAALLLLETLAEMLDALPEDERIALDGQLGELRPEVETSRTRDRTDAGWASTGWSSTG